MNFLMLVRYSCFSFSNFSGLASLSASRNFGTGRPVVTPPLFGPLVGGKKLWNVHDVVHRHQFVEIDLRQVHPRRA